MFCDVTTPTEMGGSDDEVERVSLMHMFGRVMLTMAGFKTGQRSWFTHNNTDYGDRGGRLMLVLVLLSESRVFSNRAYGNIHFCHSSTQQLRTETGNSDDVVWSRLMEGGYE